MFDNAKVLPKDRFDGRWRAGFISANKNSTPNNKHSPINQLNALTDFS
ncbi:hypothetical protein AO382_1929 [Moraxella catarrhalis]|uniref:Uncharacterized protein n=1 Tax=Moraxella catarrhalis TaxID=480 RepID=A0A7Z1A375_MORCA|nr:hypothetical protein AO382_1929 [Moraxella catarrhalis]